jgi:hypothetical protein
MQTAALLTATLGDALVAPADVTVVVPGVVADMVVSAAPVFKIVMAVPMPKLVVASVGMLTVLAEALDVMTRTWYWSVDASV